jgi:hypothetical protein
MTATDKIVESADARFGELYIYICGRPPPGNEAARRSRGGEAEPKRFIGNSNNTSPNSATELGEQATRKQRRRLALFGGDRMPLAPLRLVGAQI